MATGPGFDGTTPGGAWTHLLFLLERFPEGARRLSRLDLLRRLGVLRLLDLLRDDLRFVIVCPSLDAELVAEPAGEFFDDLHDQAEPGPNTRWAKRPSLAHRACQRSNQTDPPRVTSN